MQLTTRKIVWLQQVHSDKRGCMNDIKAYEQSCIVANTYLISSKNSASLIHLTQQISSICQFFAVALDVLAIDGCCCRLVPIAMLYLHSAGCGCGQGGKYLYWQKFMCHLLQVLPLVIVWVQVHLNPLAAESCYICKSIWLLDATPWGSTYKDQSK